ncbi:hypothetical protein JNW88_23985, partial [Micromonospora sp. ATA32]|nr:hypothetical protein [Micromonospora sp. ATA32]
TAGSHLRTLAPYARLVTPGWPGEASALLGATPAAPAEACAALRALGATAVALTQGSGGSPAR